MIVLGHSLSASKIINHKMCEIISVDMDELSDMFKQSAIYKSLKDNKQLHLFSNSCNFDLNMRNYKELCSAINTLTYWRFDKIPYSYYYKVQGLAKTLKRILYENERDLSLQFETNHRFWELGIMVLCDSREEQIASAKNLKLDSLVEFLEKYT